MNNLKKRIREAIEYDGPDRMDREIERKISQGETPLSKNPSFPRQGGDESDNSFSEIIASSRFKEVVERVKRYTGFETVSDQNSFMQLQNLLMSSVRTIKSIESKHEDFLEQLAVKIVLSELSIPENTFQFDVELMSGLNQIDTSKMLKSPKNFSDDEIVKQFGVDPDEAESDIENFIEAFERFDLEKHKRRFINSLIQGASKKGHYMFHLVERELNNLDPRLLNLYGIIMSINDLMYWVLPDQMVMNAAGSGEGVEGSEQINPKTDPPTIIAKGLFFPVLIHEILKGVYESMASQGLPKDKEAAEMVMGSTDTLPYEIWDLRLGPKIWEKFVESYPDKLYDDDMREIQNYLFSKFSRLSTEEFFEVSKLILSGSNKGKKIVEDMVNEIIAELKSYEYEDSMNNDDDDDDNDLNDLLGNLGISLN
jgi:hypothetical protein